MSDFTAAIDRPQLPNIRTDCSWYPRAFFTWAEIFHGAMILTEKGKAEFRQFVFESVRLPREGSAGRKEIEEAIRSAVDLFAGMNQDCDLDDDPVSGQDEVIDNWARAGVIPPLREAVAELSMPGLTAECSDFAERNFPSLAERAAEREELSSYRVERWMNGTGPFKGDGATGRDWLPRAELWTSYETWCKFDGGGHPPGRPNDFYVALKEMGCPEAKRRGVRGFCPPRH